MTTTMKALCLLLIWLCMFHSNRSIAQHKMDAYFDHLFAQQKFMGTASIGFKDRIFYTKAVGYANADSKKQLTNNSKFRVGSITKTFTAALVLKAVEEQKLRLDDKLALYYPLIKNADKITITHLLQHRSGIVNYSELPGEAAWEAIPHSQEAFINFFINEPANFEPGTDYEYSNTNYALLGFIIEQLYKLPYARIVDQQICQPLALHNTYYTTTTDTARNEAISYNIQNRYIKNSAVDYSNNPGSGGIVSTAIDINKFLFALFNGKVINAASLTNMLPVNKSEYGMGIIKLNFDRPEGYEHSGRIENFISSYWYFPADSLGIVVLANAVNINTDDISMALLQYAYGNAPSLPDFNRIDSLPVKAFTAIKGTYYSKDKSYSITISSDSKTLVFQQSTVGQDYVPFDYQGNNTFSYKDITLKFYPKKKQVQLTQAGHVNIYTK